MPVFETLEPPPHGLARLRGKLEHSRRQRLARAAAWVAVPALCTGLLALWMVPPDGRAAWEGVENPALVRLGMQAAPTGEGVHAAAGTAVRLVDGVYWVDSARPVESRTPRLDGWEGGSVETQVP